MPYDDMLLVQIERLFPALFAVVVCLAALHVGCDLLYRTVRKARRLLAELSAEPLPAVYAFLAGVARTVAGAVHRHLEWPDYAWRHPSSRVSICMRRGLAIVSCVLFLLVFLSFMAVVVAYFHYFDLEKYTLKIHAVALVYVVAAMPLARILLIDAFKSW